MYNVHNALIAELIDGLQQTRDAQDLGRCVAQLMSGGTTTSKGKYVFINGNDAA